MEKEFVIKLKDSVNVLSILTFNDDSVKIGMITELVLDDDEDGILEAYFISDHYINALKNKVAVRLEYAQVEYIDLEQARNKSSKIDVNTIKTINPIQ